MVRNGDCVAIFNSIHRVMKAEKALKARGLDILLIPVPRALQSDCGLAVRYPSAISEMIDAALAAENLLPEEIFIKNGAEYSRIG